MAKVEGMGIHEDFAHNEVLKIGSNRTFGLAVGAIFSIIGTVKFLLNSPNSTFAWLFGFIGFGLIISGCLFPSRLSTLNYRWMRFGQFLSRMTTPITMGILYYTLITPLGIFMRLCGYHPLGAKFDKEAKTYWKNRPDAEFNSKTMKWQF